MIDWDDVAHRSNGAAAQHLPPISRATEQDWAKALVKAKAFLDALAGDFEKRDYHDD